MKFKYIVYVVIATILLYFGLKTPVRKYCLQKQELTLTPASCLFLRPQFQELQNKRDSLIEAYLASVKSCNKWKKNCSLLRSAAQKLPLCKEAKEEIVYIKRVSSAFIMNSPASYELSISNNMIKEDGEGEDTENLTMFYLSDGKIIRSSPKQNSDWLGAKEGEKVLKTRGICLVFDEETELYDAVSYTEYTPLYK